MHVYIHIYIYCLKNVPKFKYVNIALKAAVVASVHYLTSTQLQCKSTQISKFSRDFLVENFKSLKQETFTNLKLKDFMEKNGKKLAKERTFWALYSRIRLKNASRVVSQKATGCVYAI